MYGEKNRTWHTLSSPEGFLLPEPLVTGLGFLSGRLLGGCPSDSSEGKSASLIGRLMPSEPAGGADGRRSRSGFE